MAEIDPSIALSVKPVQIGDPIEGMARAYQLKNLGLQNAQGQQDYDDNQTLRSLVSQHTTPAGGIDQPSLIKDVYAHGMYKQANAMQQQQLATQTQQSNLQKTQTETSGLQLDQAQKKLSIVSNSLASLLQDPNLNHDQVYNQIHNLVNQGLIDPEKGAEMSRQLPGDPTQLRAFLVSKAQETQSYSQQIDNQLKTAPTLQNTGGALTAIDPITKKPIAGAAPIPMTASPDSVLSANTSTANNRANITKDYAVNGLNPDGSPGEANNALVKMIGENRIVPSDRLESTPRGQAILAAVEAQYPGYDRSTAQAKVSAARDFTTGKDAAALRSIGTATKHLDMLGGLVDNLNNTNSPIFNTIANTFKAQTGQTAPTTFDAAKQIVGQEVIKAIVAGGGGVGERQEAADALSKAKSPAQLKDVIATYKTIMGAQHESLLQQRDAAGLSRSTLPDYTEGASNSGSLGQSKAQGAVVPIKSDSDYASLPSGTRFQAPDGTIRVKP